TRVVQHRLPAQHRRRDGPAQSGRGRSRARENRAPAPRHDALRARLPPHAEDEPERVARRRGDGRYAGLRVDVAVAVVVLKRNERVKGESLGATEARWSSPFTLDPALPRRSDRLLTKLR